MYAKYQAAEKLLTKHTRTSVLNGRLSIHWVDERHFFYQRQVRAEGEIKEVTVHVDARTGEETLSSAPAREAEVRYEQETGRRISETAESASHSPCGTWSISSKDHNLVLTDRRSGLTFPLTTDGTDLYDYGSYIDIYSQITARRAGQADTPQILWSPDGRRFLTYRADRRSCGKLRLIESFADREEDLRPRLWDYPCPFAPDTDDSIPHYRLFVGDAETKTFLPIDSPDFLYPVFTDDARSTVRWTEDGSAFYFTWIKRGFQEGRLYLGSPSDGKTQLLITETTDRFLNLGAFGLVDGFGSYLFSNFVTQDRRYAFWQSEQSGYAHLYRFCLDEAPSGMEKGVDLLPAEHSRLIVQKIVRVDEAAEKIYFMANNVPECSDPLYYQLYVIGFDGRGLTRLTPEDAVHSIRMSGEGFVDTFSRVDLPPVTVLRRLDGTLVRELERADISDLLCSGYQIPERFSVKAADHSTELCGILIRPADFDPEKTYPVIDYIYGGAQLYNVPRDFTWDNSMDREIFGGLQEFAQLGFAGIILDGRGTPGRGMDFHSFSHHNIHGCAGLEDHAFCMPQLKEQFPFLDLDRVGIWGNSGGGYATVSALFKYPELYKVGVASSGNYDQRVYEHSWTERYYGLYDPLVYRDGDITALADRLQGRLLLAYGAMDDNVTMSQTLRLCDRLNQANKDYDLLVLPRMNHNVPSDLYFVRRKMDFFVRHLLGEEPPKEFSF